MIISNKDNCMDIQEFLNSRSYSEKVKKGGLEYLLNKWEKICQRIPFDHKYQFDEYLNDLLTRCVINDIVENCEIDKESIQILDKLDTLFRNKTIEIKKCVYDDEIVLKRNYNVKQHWFYFRVPAERIPNWFSSSVAPI